MGGQVRLVHLATLNRSVARLVSCRERAWGREPLFSGGARPHLFTLSPRCCLFRSPERVAAVVVFGPVFSFCFLSGGYAPPIGIAPRFWIVYALAMRSVAYYALGCVSSCAHLTVRRCRAGRVVVCGVSTCGCVVRLAFC